ncbi:hypothetical protein [Acidisphaera sp. L21]|uniref:hypothetical protein n=1 Tax=Acidisphaera sp. L21 TaxID=1641851 RepID=UPI00131D4246|nr:hypothetical protein [Acidisphaera sp. L21]
MSAVIDAEPDAAGLPPPLLLSVSHASQLLFTVRRDRTDGVAMQLMSTRKGEGVSTLVRDLSLVAASQGGLRTLLLSSEPLGRHGANWPRSVYGLPSGLRAIADGPAELEMYRVGPTGLVAAAPIGNTVQPQTWATLLRALRPQFDIIITDSPPLDRSFTGIVLAPHMDATLLVVAAESTRASAVRTLRDRLAEVGGHTAGVILNKRRFHVPQAAYERL